MKYILRWMSFCAVLLLVISGALTTQATLQPRIGGQLVVALEAEPPNLDMHWSSLNFIRYIAFHINEQLFTLDEEFRPIPMLAEGYTTNEDETVYDIALRQGVFFHNAQELTAEDAAASLNRWIQRSSVGKSIAFNVQSIEAADRYTVRLTLNEPMGFVITALAVFRQGAGIYPKSVIDEAGVSDPITDYIGTGPYEFVEWRKGESVLLRRYEGYAAREEAAAGYGGRRTAYLDEIKFVFVSEPSVRTIGIQAGDFHFAWPISNDDFDRLNNDPNLVSLLSAPRILAILLNADSEEGIPVKVRQAIQAAVDAEEILAGVFGNPRFWRLDPGIMWQETAWWSDVGADRYNQGNPELAKELLSDAGYNGEPLRMIVSAPERLIFDTALILEQQLSPIGLNIVREDFDVATHRALKKDPTKWEISPMDSTYRTHPTMHLHINPAWDGRWSNPEKESLVKQLLTEQDPDKAYDIWTEIEELYYEDVPIIKIGDFFDYVVIRSSVKGYAQLPEPFFWNVWLEE